jgi:hypothetical protein
LLSFDATILNHPVVKTIEHRIKNLIPTHMLKEKNSNRKKKKKERKKEKVDTEPACGNQKHHTCMVKSRN